MPNGILIIDKPAGWTSMDVCARIRTLLRERRVGHGGTLDPMATGVLPVFVGRATRAAEFSERGRKEYLAGLRLGVVTDTQDVTGTVLEERPVSAGEADVRAALSAFTGEISQIPPMYSAVKVDGQRLYALARKGKEVERPARDVTVFALELTERLNETDYLLRCECSKGTYVRTLCHDIGRALGCGGVMFSLRRTRAAGFGIEEAVTLSDVEARGEALLRPVDSLFGACPVYTPPSPGKETRIRNGAPVTEPELAPGLYRVYGAGGEFLCLSQARDGVLTSVKNFF